MNELTQSRVKSATAYWGEKVATCNAEALTAVSFAVRNDQLALAGRYAEGFLREVQLLLANDEVMAG